MRIKLIWKKFIDFWKEFYDDLGKPDSKYYDPYINKELTKESLAELWRWKAGQYFKNIRRQLKKIEEKLDEINNFKKSNPHFEELYEFSRMLFRSGVVYTAFLIHICKPKEYPIFDQNAFRAFVFLNSGKLVNAPKNIEDYHLYKNFVLKLENKYKLNLRDIDKALFAFGQFLKNPKKFIKN